MPFFELIPEKGNEDVLVFLGDMARRMADFTPAMISVARTFAEHEKSVFTHEGPGWAALKPTTIALKSSMGWSNKILGPRTGALQASLTGSGIMEGTLALPFEVTMGTTMPYAKFHQYGSASKGGHHGNVKRPLIKITPQMILTWRKILEEWLLTGETFSVF